MRPCKATNIHCGDCLKTFYTISTLKRHRKRYCRSGKNHLSSQDCVGQLPEPISLAELNQEAQSLKFEFSKPDVIHTPSVVNPSSSAYKDDVKEEQKPKVLYAPTIENSFSFSKLDDVKEVENTGMMHTPTIDFTIEDPFLRSKLDDVKGVENMGVMATPKIDLTNENPYSCSKLDDVNAMQNPLFCDSLQAFIDEMKSSSPLHAKGVENTGVMQTPKIDRTIENPFSCSKLDDVQGMKNPRFTDSLLALLDEIKFSSPSHDAMAGSEIPAVSTTQTKDRNLLNHSNNTLYSWLQEIQRLEGACKSDAIIKNDIFLILHRMLQDGLLLESEYNELKFTSDLFIKLHQLINMYIPSLHKRDIFSCLLELYDLKRIDKTALIEVCLSL